MRKLIAFFSIIILFLLAGKLLSNLYGDSSPRGKLGLTILPANDDWSEENFQKAITAAKSSGISLTHTYCQWGNLENSFNNYNWADLDYDLDFFAQNKLKTSIVIKIINGNELGALPLDISTSNLDEQFSRRFLNFVSIFLKHTKGKIEYLWIGNKVDNYLHKNPEQAEGFLSLLSQTNSLVKAMSPGTKVGTIISYQDAKANSMIKTVNKIANLVDIMGISFYQTKGTTRFKGSAKDAEKGLIEAINIIKCPRLAIVETGWNTNPKSGGSNEKQKEYVKIIFDFLQKNGNRIDFLNFHALHDIPKEKAEEKASFFAKNVKERDRLADIINYNGLFKVDGSPKPAWQTWKNNAKNWVSNH